jgi:hypothetical protein
MLSKKFLTKSTSSSEEIRNELNEVHGNEVQNGYFEGEHFILWVHFKPHEITNNINL